MTWGSIVSPVQDRLYRPPSRNLRVQTTTSGQPASAPSAMSDLNSPEKPRSEHSPGGSQPHSWLDVTLIEDITQESLSRRLSAQCLGEYIQGSSESEAEQPSPTEPLEQPLPSQIPAQAVCVVKRFRVRTQSRGPALPIAPASDSTQLNPCTRHSTRSRALGLPNKRASGPEYHSLQAREACSQASSHLLRGGLSTYLVSQCPNPDP